MTDLAGEHYFIAANPSFPALGPSWHLEKQTFNGKPYTRKVRDVACLDCTRLGLNDGEWHEMGD